MTALVDAIAERLRSGRPSTDLGGAYVTPHPPASIRHVADAEAQLGFALPSLLRDIYTTIGNGGFGPGYGLIGLTAGAPSQAGHHKQDIVSLYHSFRCTSTSHEPWGERMLPICTWGCTYFSYLDCALPRVPVLSFDENSHGHGPWGCAFSLHAASFEEWMQRWANGEDLWRSIELSGAPKLGFEEYANDGAPVRLSRTYGVPPDAVFDAWLMPEIMRRWFFKPPDKEVVRLEVNACEGGRYSLLVGAGDEAIHYSGVYELIARPHKLVFSLEAPRISQTISRVSLEIAPVPAGSQLDLTHTGLPARVVTGPWNVMLDALGGVLESKRRVGKGAAGAVPTP